MALQRLFSAGTIGSLRLKNRIVHAPMVRNYGDEVGRVTPRYVDHIRRIAAGGVGAVIIEASYVLPGGKGFARQLGIHRDDMVAGLRRLVAAAHAEDAAIGIQLFHGGRQASQNVSGSQPVAPSPIPDPVVNEPPRALTVPEIHDVVAAFGAAARRAKRAGFDFIELHGAHGYLINQFLSPFSNVRTDRYGGSAKNRLQFLDEVYAAVRAEVGPDYPVTVRLSADEFVHGGITIRDTIRTAKHLERRGVAAVHISAGNYASFAQGLMISPMAIPDAPLATFAARVKAAVKIPVIAVNKIRTPELAERLLERGDADFIALGRPLLADPDWPAKARARRSRDIRPCIACNQACIGRLFAQQDVACTVNAAAGHERVFARRRGQTKRVLVVGAGPAGLEAARIAAERGHRVTLVEERRRLGGQLGAAAATPFRADWRRLLWSLQRSVTQLGVTIRTGTPLKAEDVRRNSYDAAIVATGSTEALLNLPGSGGPLLLQARALLAGRATARGIVVVAGGGCAGAQTAEYLADLGHSVTIVEATADIAAEAPLDDRALLLGRLARHGVSILTDTRLLRVAPGKVAVQTPGGRRVLRADTIVVCVGAVANAALAESLARRVARVVVVGDAKSPRRVTDAIREGALAALGL